MTHAASPAVKQGKTRSPFLAFLTDDASIAAAQAYAKKQNVKKEAVHNGGMAEAVEFLTSQPSPELLLVEISSTSAAPEELDALADVCDPNVKVIVTGTVNEFSFYTWLMDIGISGYVLQPFTAEQLQEAADKALKPEVTVQDAPKEDGKVIAVVGARGGVGATTVAVNLAWSLAMKHACDTALLDLDPQQGSVAIALDLEPGRGLRDALEKPDRIDGMFMDRVMIRYHDTLSILAAEEPWEHLIKINDNASEAMIRESKCKHAFTIVDVPRNQTAFTRKALEMADEVVLVTEQTLLCLRDALRMHDLFKDVLRIDPPLVVASKTGVATKFEMPTAEFEKGLGAKIAHTIPFTAEAYAAMTEGQVLVEYAKKSASVKVLEELASRFVEETQEDSDTKPKKNVLGFLKGSK